MKKRMRELYKNIEGKKFLTSEEVLKVIKDSSNAKFIESVDISIILGTDPTKSDQVIRTSLTLPHGRRKSPRIIAFVSDEKKEEAKKAGADIVGLDDIIEEIKRTEKVEADICVCSPDVFAKVAKIAKILSGAGAMPNAKDGTVTANLSNTIKQIKEGKYAKIKSDSSAQIKLSVGDVKMSEKNLLENIKAILAAVHEIKPAKVKELVKRVFVSSTMGIGLELPIKR